MIWEPPNKDIIQIESIILIRSKKYESDDEDHEKHRATARAINLWCAQIIAQGAPLILLCSSQSAAAWGVRSGFPMTLDEPRCRTGFYQLVVTSRRGL